MTGSQVTVPILMLNILFLDITQINSFTTKPFFITKNPTFLSCIPKIKAASREEDLELTRQIILEHISFQKQQGVTADESESSETTTTAITTTTSTNIPIMIKAAKKQTVERTPVWLFRQAGRHLPEYQAYKKEVNRNFWQMLQYPSDVAECTLQPLRRYKDGLDAAILFSDILVIPAAMGMEVTMPGGVGIQVPNPIQTPEDMEQYSFPTTKEEASDLVETKLGHVLESVDLIKQKMSDEGFGAKPLIGFSATPFTLLFYMVGGSSKKNKDAGVDYLKTYPEEAKKLLDTLTKIVIEYVVKQVEHGAQLLQFFEAMGMMIDEETFLEYELDCLKEIAVQVRQRVGEDVPLMVFARGASYANAYLAKIPEYDVITIDGSINRSNIRSELPEGTVLQGNFDPKEFIISKSDDLEDGLEIKSKESVKQSAIEYLQELGPKNLIANLGEGLGGLESPELVNEFLTVIAQESEKMLQE